MILPVMCIAVLLFREVAAAAPAQEAYLKASNSAMGDSFGYSVAVSGDTVVVGAKREAGSATRVNGNQKVRTSKNAGGVYVFVRHGTNWTQQAYLKASNAGPGDSFGCSVAISGDTIVVGAEWDGSSGLHPARNDTKARESGSAFVFVRQGTNWIQQASLKAPDAKPGHGFGHSVSVSGDILVVGAINDSSSSADVNGNQSDTGAHQAGAAYVFVRQGTNWAQEAYIKASNPNKADRFGRSVAVSGSTVVVGASAEDSKATGVNGDQADNSVQDAGAAYVFVRNGANWNQQAYLKASNPGVEADFGKSVAISGDLVVIGANHERSTAAGVNGDQSGANAISSGAAYIFVRQGTNWSQQAFLKAHKSKTEVNTEFGISVAVSGEMVVVGAVGDTSSAKGINGIPNNTDAPGSGAAYVFMRSGTNWSQRYYLKASNPDGCAVRNYLDLFGRPKSSVRGTCDLFGWSVGVSGDTVVVGAIGEASKATGVNGNQNDNSTKEAGAAYVFGGSY
jgi:hypothetical protein